MTHANWSGSVPGVHAIHMKNLDNLSPSDLIDEFVRISLAQYEAIESDSSRKYNRLFDRIGKVEAALKAMPGDQRRMLLALYTHQNIFVRLRSAQATREITPAAARQVFEGIALSGIYPYAADAKRALRYLNG